MMTRRLVLAGTDLALLVYWTLSATHVISVGEGAVLEAWNWSFLPLDLAAAGTGLAWSLAANRRWAPHLLTVSLTLTGASGLMALSFFALWGEWDASWWIANAWLLAVPTVVALVPRHRRDTR